MKKLTWFRLYSEAVDDEKLRLLAFEDRWHFVALLCCKAQGILDEEGEIRNRKIAVKLGLSVRELEEVSRRLAEVGLVDQATLAPLAWNSRQYVSDQDPTAAERQKRWREKQADKKRNALRNGPVTDELRTQETETETETEKKKTLRSRAFVPPTVDQVKAYCLERGNNVDPQRFVDHYTSNGWMVGKNKMKDWKAAVRSTWERGDIRQTTAQSNEPRPLMKEFPR